MLDSGARKRCAAAALLALSWLLAHAARAADPTAQELHFWYEVNRARSDPPGWAAEYGLGAVTGGDGQPVTLLGVSPRPPLALQPTLVDSSRFKAQEMAANDYFAHLSPVDGRQANGVVRSFGYALPATFPVPGTSGSFYVFDDEDNGIESLAAGCCGFDSQSGLDFDYTQGVNAVIGLIIDDGVPSLGHRLHLLAIDPYNAIFVEAGAGYGFDAGATYRNYWAFHTGVRSPPATFLTGVAFADGNGNSLFDPGEGLAGVTIDAGSTSAVTGATGGYALEIASGTHTVTCSGGGFAGTASAGVAVVGSNRQVDCISGQPAAWVDFVPAPEPETSAAGAVALAVLAARRRARRSERGFVTTRER